MSELDPSDLDRALCRDLLPQVSRTFALSIEALPDELRQPVRTAYLLCRIIDSIEDAEVIPSAQRETLFDAFDTCVTDDSIEVGSLQQGFRATISEASGISKAERRLGSDAGSVLRVFRCLPSGHRQAIRPHLLEMSQGMRCYTSRSPREITSMADLEHYCYFVAGTVGRMLNELFLQHVRIQDAEARYALEDLAVSFGIGLQLVNIVKDVAGDFQRGVCYLPRTLADRHGLCLEKLLEPDQRKTGLAVIEQIVNRAREHLGRARQYTTLWPVPSGVSIRLFCVVPLALALATLEEVGRGRDTLIVGRSPSVSRETVLAISDEAPRAVLSDEGLNRLLSTAW